MDGQAAFKKIKRDPRSRNESAMKKSAKLPICDPQSGTAKPTGLPVAGRQSGTKDLARKLVDQQVELKSQVSGPVETAFAEWKRWSQSHHSIKKWTLTRRLTWTSSVQDPTRLKDEVP
ncbi:hypothetical protein PDE_09114 [Penicillium oxalicum 114-2]|uniref:Uncharacterized protein n=1 Tax=Penicillium oxalicum (strain 114-2 / CGMCC 5302) TaxID=933388 RepID=S7ZTV8_PENO1|nr:hypothetical protein PDE_09114 [Penicillium oxalicum 114-2]